MHFLFAGIVKRNLSSLRMKKCSNKLCHIGKKNFEPINSRLTKFAYCLKFKRTIKPLDQLGDYKCSIFLEFFFYLHWFLIYAISKLWNENLNEKFSLKMI